MPWFFVKAHGEDSAAVQQPRHGEVGGLCRGMHGILPVGTAKSTAKPVRLLTAGACWQVLEALSNSDRTRNIAPEAVRTHVAWKTGTSSGRRDAWCAAVTRTRTVVVWFGNVNGGGSASLVGQEAAAPVALRLIAALCPAQAAHASVKETHAFWGSFRSAWTWPSR